MIDIVRFVEGSAATTADVAAVRTDLRDAVQQLTLRGLFGAVSLFFALLAAEMTDERLSAVKRRITMLTWMVGLLYGPVLAILVKAFV